MYPTTSVICLSCILPSNEGVNNTTLHAALIIPFLRDCIALFRPSGRSLRYPYASILVLCGGKNGHLSPLWGLVNTDISCWTPHQHAIRACCLSEAIVNRIQHQRCGRCIEKYTTRNQAPAVRKVYGIKQAIMIFCQLDMV